MILVVDDEPSIRRFAARALLEEGFPVREAADGAQALEIVRAGGVSVLVSDVVMPRLNGVQLMEALARSHPRLPVLLMSGYAAAELDGMGIAPPCGCWPSHSRAERLVEEVRRCLPGGSARRGGRDGAAPSGLEGGEMPGRDLEQRRAVAVPGGPGERAGIPERRIRMARPPQQVVQHLVAHDHLVGRPVFATGRCGGPAPSGRRRFRWST